MGKINICTIIREHFSSLYIIKNDEKKNDYKAYFWLFGLPIVLTLIIGINWKSLTLNPFCIEFNMISSNLGNSLLSSLSILSPLMFSFIPIIYSLIDNSDINADSKDYIKEFKSNVLFTMLLSFSGLGFLIVWSVFNDYWLISLVIYLLVFSLVFHILMLIQRFNFLLNEFIKFRSN